MFRSVRLVHRYWDTDDDPGLCNASVYTEHGCEVVDWTRATVPFVLPDIRGDVDGARHRSNLARYRLLAEHGGVYADHDVWPRPEFFTYQFPLNPWVTLFDGWLCGALIGGGPADVWLEAFELGTSPAPISWRAPKRSGQRVIGQLHSEGRIDGVADLLVRVGHAGGIAEHSWATSSR